MTTLFLRAALALVPMLAPPAAARAETLWLAIENWSEVEVILDVRIVPAFAPGWGPNEVAYGAVWPGFATDVAVDVADTCHFDILIETDRMVHEAWGVDLCQTVAIVITDGEAWIETVEDPWAGW